MLIFVFLTEFKKFKGFGIEGELLDQKIGAADRLLTESRDLAAPMAEMLISTVAGAGRWGSGMSRAKKYELIQRVTSELERSGVTDAQLKQAQQEWHFYNLFDLSSPIIDGVIDRLQEHLKQCDGKLNDLPKPITIDAEYQKIQEARNEVGEELGKIRSLHSLKDQTNVAGAIRSAVKNSVVLTDSEKEEILDMHREELLDAEYYAQHKEFRRLDVWLSGAEE